MKNLESTTEIPTTGNEKLIVNSYVNKKFYSSYLAEATSESPTPGILLAINYIKTIVQKLTSNKFIFGDLQSRPLRSQQRVITN